MRRVDCVGKFIALQGNASNMQTYDILMLVVLAATTIFGAIKGFAWQLASLGSIVASYFVAYAFRNDVAKMINADPPWNVFLAMLLLYFGSSFVIWMVFRLVSSSIDKVRLREFDRHLGAGFGLLKGMILCLLITMFAMSLLGASQQQRIANSKSGLYISRVLANAGGLLPVEIKQVVGPYLDDVGQKLQDGQRPGVQLPYSAEATKIDSAVKDILGGVSERIGQAAEQFKNAQEQAGRIGEAAEQAQGWLNEKLPNARIQPGGQLPPSQFPAPQYPTSNQQYLPSQYDPPAPSGFSGQNGYSQVLPNENVPQAPSGGYGTPFFVPNQPKSGSGGVGTY